jgi:hypothetical protein
VLCQCCDRDFQSCTWFDRDDTLPFVNRIVLTVIGRLPPPATIPTAPDGTLSECRVESAPSCSELRSMFDRKLADHLVIGGLDATVYGRSLKPPSPRAFRSSKEAPTPKPGLFFARSAER